VYAGCYFTTVSDEYSRSLSVIDVGVDIVNVIGLSHVRDLQPPCTERGTQTPHLSSPSFSMSDELGLVDSSDMTVVPPLAGSTFNIEKGNITVDYRSLVHLEATWLWSFRGQRLTRKKSTCYLGAHRMA